MRAYTSRELRNPAELTELYLDNADVTSEDLPGIVARFPKLIILSLDGNQITDVGPLAGLTKLKGLYIVRNHVTDVSPLAGLIDLEYLGLTENQISDVTTYYGPLIDPSLLLR